MFLERRNEAAKKVFENISPDYRPQLALGAEVQFVPELYAMDDVEKLCISGTRYLLVEMPFVTWSGYTYKALNKMYTAKGIVPIVAHVERYLDFQNEYDATILRNIRESNALIQINSSFLINKQTRRKALNLVKKGLINFMGSDCHNMETRKPEIIEAFDIIYDKFGEDGVASFEYWEEKLKDRIETF